MRQYFNDYSIPIAFVIILMSMVAFLGGFLQTIGILAGLVIGFVVLYYFGKQHDGIIYTIALFLMSLAWDLIQAPYCVDPTIGYNPTSYLSGLSIDCFIGQIGTGLGLNGLILFYFTYVLGFIAIFGLALFLAKKISRKRTK